MSGFKKINVVDEYFPTGAIVNYRCEYISRPIIVAAIVLSSPEIVDFLLKFKADLTLQYEGYKIFKLIYKMCDI